MKRFFFTAALILASGALFAAKIEVFTADNIVQLVKDKLTKTQSFAGSFVYSMNGKNSSGVIKFRSPNKFVMEFHDGQKIISDGKNLWLIFKSENIAINEPLDKEKKTPMVGWNINRLIKEFVPTLPKTGYQVQYNGKSAFKLIFIPKSNTSGFRYINMIISENGDIWKMEAANQLGAVIELSVNYYSFNEGVNSKDFEYEPDENTQIYENILLPHDEENSSQED